MTSSTEPYVRMKGKERPGILKVWVYSPVGDRSQQQLIFLLLFTEELFLTLPASWLFDNVNWTSFWGEGTLIGQQKHGEETVIDRQKDGEGMQNIKIAIKLVQAACVRCHGT